MRWLLRSKIHRAVVTEANVEYAGSITIDKHLIEAAGLWLHEKVSVVSLTSGERLETYVIEGDPGSGEICMNGAAALRIDKGEEVIIMGYELTDKPIEAKIVHVDGNNRIK